MQTLFKHTTQSITLAVQARWQARSPRERRLLTITTAVIVMSVYIGLLVSGQRASAALREGLPTLRLQAATLERQASELERLRLLPAAVVSNSSLLPLVQDLAMIAGLADMLSSTEALDSQRVVVAFGTLPFPLWIDWLNTLSLQGIRVENVTMETLLTPGLVSTRATLLRAGAP